MDKRNCNFLAYILGRILWFTYCIDTKATSTMLYSPSTDLLSIRPSNHSNDQPIERVTNHWMDILTIRPMTTADRYMKRRCWGGEKKALGDKPALSGTEHQKCYKSWLCSAPIATNMVAAIHSLVFFIVLADDTRWCWKWSLRQELLCQLR